MQSKHYFFLFLVPKKFDGSPLASLFISWWAKCDILCIPQKKIYLPKMQRKDLYLQKLTCLCFKMHYHLLAVTLVSEWVIVSGVMLLHFRALQACSFEAKSVTCNSRSPRPLVGFVFVFEFVFVFCICILYLYFVFCILFIWSKIWQCHLQ